MSTFFLFPCPLGWPDAEAGMEQHGEAFATGELEQNKSRPGLALAPDSKDMAMDQYLLIPFLVGWTSIYQLFWCSPGV